MTDSPETVDGQRQQVRRAVITGMRWLATARLIAQVSSWIITLVVIRLLTPTDYGLQSMAAVAYTTLLLLSQSSLDLAIARQRDFDIAQVGQVLGFTLVLNLLVMIAVWLAAPYLAAYYQEEAVAPLLRVLAFGFLISVFQTIPLGLAFRNLDYRNHALARLIGTVSGSVATLILAMAGYGVWSLILGMLITTAASAIFLQFRTRWLVMPRLSMTGIAPLLKYGWTLSLGFFVWTVAWRLDILIGGKPLAAAELGFYVVAIHLCTLPLGKIMPLANELLYPAYAKLQADTAAINVYFEKALASICFVMFPMFLGLAAISHWFVPVVFGDRWVGIEQVVVIVALAMPFRVVLTMCQPMLNATGNAMTLLTTGVFAAGFIATAVLVGLRWGVIGLAFAALTATPVLMGIVVWRTRQLSGLSPGSLTRSIAPPLGISAAMAIIVYLSGTVLEKMLPDSVVIGLQVVVGVLSYIALAAVFARGLSFSTLSIIRTGLKLRRQRSG